MEVKQLDFGFISDRELNHKILLGKQNDEKIEGNMEIETDNMKLLNSAVMFDLLS